MENEQYMILHVDSLEYENQRIDVFLAAHMSDVSRSFVQKLLEHKMVEVNGKTAKSNKRVQLNDLIKVQLPEAVQLEVLPEDLPLDIIYEDNEVIVVNKARGMVVHPAAGNYHGTLVNALLGCCKDLSGINGVIRPGIVHRLDKDTSGVMVVAKNDRAHVNLAEQIKERNASRQYLAILRGNLSESAGRIDAAIGRHPKERKKMAVDPLGGKEAITDFEVVERFGTHTLVRCKLHTGRTHQIRVHMAYIGHPVLGDPVYGTHNTGFNIQGQALHATELSFFHPQTGNQMTFHAKLPKDMDDILQELRIRSKR